jgi:NitT/TauT family transport system ATP-binding protein
MTLPKLCIEKLRKEFRKPGRKEPVVAIEDFNLEVMEYEFVAIVGPSGCGKSTLLRIVAGLEKPTEGVVLLDGREIVGPSPQRGMFFQEYALFPWKTVWGNVEFGLKAQKIAKNERQKIVETYLELVGLKGFEKHYPDEISGGMKQRCALARVLATDPAILLMDEPLAAVDAQTRLILQEDLLRIWGEDRGREERKTVFYVTHNIDEAVLLADRVVVMSAHPGRIKEIISIGLPRPRIPARTCVEFQEHIQQIWELIKVEAYRATLKVSGDNADS